MFQCFSVCLWCLFSQIVSLPQLDSNAKVQKTEWCTFKLSLKRKVLEDVAQRGLEVFCCKLFREFVSAWQCVCVWQFVWQCVCLQVSVSDSVCVWQSVCLTVCMCLYFCLTVCLDECASPANVYCSGLTRIRFNIHPLLKHINRGSMFFIWTVQFM